MIASFFIISCLLYSASAVIETWDCGPADRAIKINRATIMSDHIPYPGNITIDTELEVLRDLPSANLSAKLNLIKLEPERMHVDCINGFGSCDYDVCNDLIPNHSNTFCGLGLCSCPISMKKYSSSNLVYTVPDLGGPVFGAILEGNFEGNITFFNKVDDTVFGCLGMKFNIKNYLPPLTTPPS